MSERIVDGIYTINLGVKRYRDSKLKDRGGDRFDTFALPFFF